MTPADFSPQPLEWCFRMFDGCRPAKHFCRPPRAPFKARCDPPNSSASLPHFIPFFRALGDTLTGKSIFGFLDLSPSSVVFEIFFSTTMPSSPSPSSAIPLPPQRCRLHQIREGPSGLAWYALSPLPLSSISFFLSPKTHLISQFSACVRDDAVFHSFFPGRRYSSLARPPSLIFLTASGNFFGPSCLSSAFFSPSFSLIRSYRLGRNYGRGSPLLEVPVTFFSSFVPL